MPEKPKPDKYRGNVFFPEKDAPTREPNDVDKTFIGYGGTTRAVDNWQAIALTAIHIFSAKIK